MAEFAMRYLETFLVILLFVFIGIAIGGLIGLASYEWVKRHPPK